MARRLRVDFPGAWHHVAHRGVGHTPIFASDAHCVLFLDELGAVAARFGLEIHGYALLPDREHLLVRSVHGNLSDAMRHLSGAYTQRLNRLHGWEGPVFQGRFASQLVMDDEAQRALLGWLHLAPVEAELVKRPDDRAWTSHRAQAGLDPAPPWLTTDHVRALFGGPKRLAEAVQRLRSGKDAWPEDFARASGRFRMDRVGAGLPRPRRARGAAKAKGPDAKAIIAEVAKLTHVSIRELKTARRGRGANPARRFAVLVLGDDPTLNHRDIAEALAMSVRQVGSLLQRARQHGTGDDLAAWREAWSKAH